MDRDGLFQTGFWEPTSIDPTIFLMSPLLTALIIVLIGMAYPNVIRAVFYPFANQFQHHSVHGIYLYVIAVLSTYAGILLVVALRTLVDGSGSGFRGWQFV